MEFFENRRKLVFHFFSCFARKSRFQWQYNEAEGEEENLEKCSRQHFDSQQPKMNELSVILKIRINIRLRNKDVKNE